MKTIAIALILSACLPFDPLLDPPRAHDSGVAIDAALAADSRIRDASHTPDAASCPPERVCEPIPFCPPQPLSCPGPGCPPMGNLPASRTVTLTPSDEFPSALGNEMQDAIIGHKRKPFLRTVQPNFIGGGTAGAWTFDNKVVGASQQAMVKSLTAAPAGNNRIPISFDDGDRITGLTIPVVGDNSVDISFFVFWSAGFAAVSELGSISVTNLSTTGQVLTLLGPGGVGTFTPKILAAGDFVYINVVTSAANLWFMEPVGHFDRL